MASPQLEDGYTRIANELYEALCRFRWKGYRECNIAHAVIRLTYGFQRKHDKISYGQLSKNTRIGRREIIRLVNDLVLHKVLKFADSGVHATREIRTIGINKDFNQWIPWGSGVQATRLHSGVQATRDSGVQATRDSGVHATLQRKKEIKKETPLISPQSGGNGKRPASSPEGLFAIPLTGTQGEYLVTQEKINQWQETFPGLDVMQTVRECRQWNIDNKDRRKTKGGIERHISRWLSNANDKGRNRRDHYGIKKDDSPVRRALDEFLSSEDEPG